MDKGIIQKYAELVRGAYSILNNDGFGNNNQVEHIAEQKAKVVLQEMHGKDFSTGSIIAFLSELANNMKKS